MDPLARSMRSSVRCRSLPAVLNPRIHASARRRHRRPQILHRGLLQRHAAHDSRRHFQDGRHESEGTARTHPLRGPHRRRPHRQHGFDHRRPFQAHLPRTSPIELNVGATPYTLSDVVLFLNTSDDLFTVNPFTGQMTTFVTRPNVANEFLGQASPTSKLGYLDMAMRDDGRMYSMSRGFGDNNTATTNGTFMQFDPSDAHPMSVRSNALTTFVVNPDLPINDDGTWAFQAPDTDSGIMVNGMTFSSNTFNISIPTDACSSSWATARRRTLHGNPRPPHVHDRSDYRNQLLFRLDANTGASIPATTSPTRQRTRRGAARSRTPPTSPMPTRWTDGDILAGSGTNRAARALDRACSWSVPPVRHPRRHDILDTHHGRHRRRFRRKASDLRNGHGQRRGRGTHRGALHGRRHRHNRGCLDQDKITSTHIFRPYGHPDFSPSVSATSTAALVSISGSHFVSAGSPFTTDELLDSDFTQSTAPDITGLAFLPTEQLHQ